MGAEVSGVCEDPFPRPQACPPWSVAHDEGEEPVAVPHRRKRPARRLLLAAGLGFLPGHGGEPLLPASGVLIVARGVEGQLRQQRDQAHRVEPQRRVNHPPA